MEWKEFSRYSPPKEGFYNTLRTEHDSPQVTMYLKGSGFGDRRARYWCEIPANPNPATIRHTTN